MLVTENFTQNAGSFTMEEIRYDAVVEMSEHSEDWVNSVLFYDWNDDESHQDWLDNAPIPEIVDWANSNIDSWK